MDGDRHWATTLIRGSQPKQTRCRDPSSTNTASKPKKSDIILCLLSNSAGGPSGTHWPGQCLMKCSSQDAKVFAACELPFYKGALCAFSLLLWQLQDGDGWWSSKYCHFLISRDLCWRAFGTEHACESLRHGSLQAGLFLLAVHIVLPFLVYLQRSRRLKAEAWRRRGNAACMMFSSYILLLGLLWLATSWFPTCQVRVVRFYVSCLLLLSSPRLLSSPPPPAQPRPSTHSGLCRTSTTTIHAQCSLPDLNHDHHRQCSLPDLNHDHPRPVFPAGPQPRVSPPSVPCRTSTTTIHAQCSLPDLNREYPRQKICHIECQKICQIEC